MLRRRCVGVIQFIAAMLAVPLLVGGTAAETDPQHHHDAGDPHAHHRAMLAKPQPGSGQSVDIRLLDRELVNQNGEQMKFKSEIIADRIIVMDFVYTSCTTVCPVLSAVFTQLQDRLGERLGKEVSLVSVSVDPNTDTPQRLKAYAAKHKARDEGWIWLTGRKTSVDEILISLGAYTPNFEDHPSMVLVGDGRTGQWARFYGFPSPNQIMAKVDEFVSARQVSAATTTREN